jgi:hypothetical protein
MAFEIAGKPEELPAGYEMPILGKPNQVTPYVRDSSTDHLNTDQLPNDVGCYQWDCVNYKCPLTTPRGVYHFGLIIVEPLGGLHLP